MKHPIRVLLSFDGISVVVRIRILLYTNDVLPTESNCMGDVHRIFMEPFMAANVDDDISRHTDHLFFAVIFL